MKRVSFLGGLRLFALLAILSLACKPSFAQVDTGSIVGQVTDATGAAIPNAVVTVREENTGIKTTVKSGNDGNYTISPLKIGTYTLSVTQEGFSTTERQHIDVSIQSRLEVNMAMQVGGTSQVVQVDSSSPILETQSSSIQQLVEERAINNLPLNGRNAAFLAQLSPGVTIAQNDSRGLQASGSFTANGMKRTQNNYLLDGMDNNVAIGDIVNQTQYVVMPPPDALKEFTVQTSNYSAEFGHSAGAVLNVSTKGGTNTFHGNLWEYIRNDIFDARDFFQKAALGPKPKFRQNQFGGTLGGPIWRDHTFFFVDYQGFRNVQGKTYTRTVPTLAERGTGAADAFTNLNDLITLQASAANFTADALNRTFKRGTVFDPATTRAVTAGAADPVTGIIATTSGNVRDPFYSGSIVGKQNYTDAASVALLNQIPASRMNPNAVKLLQLYPAPTNGLLVNNYTGSVTNRTNVNSFDTRLDHNFSSKDSAFFRYSFNYNDQKNPGPFAGVADGAAARPGTGYTESQNGALSWTHIISAHLVNEARVGYSRVFDKRLQPGANTAGIPDQYGIQGVPPIAQNGGLPLFNMGSLSDLGSAGTLPSDKASNVWQATENLSVDRSKHQMRFGFEFQNVAFPMATPTFSRGNFITNGVFTSLTTISDNTTDRAQFIIEPRASVVGGPNFLGGANQVQATSFPPVFYPVRRYYGAYGQDSWRVSQKLTLNLGLRYEFLGMPAERDGRLGNFQSAFTGDTKDGISRFYIPQKTLSQLSNTNVLQSLSNANVVITPTTDTAIGLAQKTNFAPRLGFAFQPYEKLSVRGGYGLFYQGNENHGLSIAPYINFPFQVTNNYVSNNSVTPVTTDGSVGPLSKGLTNVSLTPDAVNTLAKANALSYQGEPRYPKTTYSQSYSLQMQYQVAPSMIAFVGYVGSNSRHVQLSMPTNTAKTISQPNTAFASIALFPTLASGGTYLSRNGASNYNSIQFGAERRMRNGWAFTANMTYGKCLGNYRDLLDNGNTGGLRAPYVAGGGPSIDYTLCDIDVRRIVHTSGTYELPFGKGKKFLQTGIGRWVAGGWSTNWIFTGQDGQPVSVTCPTTTVTTLGCFAIKVPGQKLYSGTSGASQQPGDGFLNPAAFTSPAAAVGLSGGALSALGGPAAQVSGPAYRRLDMSLFRRFDFIHETYFQFRAEVFNLSNTPNFGQPGSLNPANAAFSQISATRDNPNNARQMQLVLKFYY